MNSVIAYKQFSLGEGLADLFASEVKNFEAFKASIVDSAKNFRQMFGNRDWDKVCYSNYERNTDGTGTWKDGCTSSSSKW